MPPADRADPDRELCTRCVRTVVWNPAKSRWVHEDTKRTWCHPTGFDYAIPAKVSA